MSNALRKLERNVIKQELKDSGYSVKRDFKDAWEMNLKKKNKKSQKIKKSTMRKKNRFFNIVKKYIQIKNEEK